MILWILKVLIKMKKNLKKSKFVIDTFFRFRYIKYITCGCHITAYYLSLPSWWRGFDSLHPLFKSSSKWWAFFMPKSFCYKDLAHMEYIIYIWMSPTLLARCMNVTAFLVNLGSNLIKNLITDLGKNAGLWIFNATGGFYASVLSW